MMPVELWKERTILKVSMASLRLVRGSWMTRSGLRSSKCTSEDLHNCSVRHGVKGRLLGVAVRQRFRIEPPDWLSERIRRGVTCLIYHFTGCLSCVCPLTLLQPWSPQNASKLPSCLCYSTTYHNYSYRADVSIVLVRGS